jgi:hypothetical protein
MRKVLLLATLILIGLPSWGLSVSHTWLLPVNQEAMRHATVMVYQPGDSAVWFPAVGVDEASGQWCWTLSTDVSPAAARGEWVVAAQWIGYAALARFTWTEGPTPLTFVAFPAPVGERGGLYFRYPSLPRDLIDQFEIIIDGVHYPVPITVDQMDGLPFHDGCHVLLKAVLKGSTAVSLESVSVVVGVGSQQT